MKERATFTVLYTLRTRRGIAKSVQARVCSGVGCVSAGGVGAISEERSQFWSKQANWQAPRYYVLQLKEQVVTSKVSPVY